MKDIRLDKYVSVALGVTRSQAKSLIKNKAIKVFDEIIKNSDYQVKDTDKVYNKEKELKYEENIYLMMNKPKGLVCSTVDLEHDTVLSLIKKYNVNKLMIVGRLDIDTTGLLLITTDGDFVHKLTSPTKEIKKKYYVKCDSEFTDSDIEAFKNGITIHLDKDEDYRCKAANLEVLDNKNEAFITISEGKYHQVKKMCMAVGKKVEELKRVQVGALLLDDKLQEGEYRKLDETEMEMFS